MRFIALLTIVSCVACGDYEAPSALGDSSMGTPIVRSVMNESPSDLQAHQFAQTLGEPRLSPTSIAAPSSLSSIAQTKGNTFGAGLRPITRPIATHNITGIEANETGQNSERAELDAGKVRQARKLEMDYFRKMGVWKKVPRARARQLRAKVLRGKWIDSNKGDSQNPNYRSRFVGK